jgi:site-specific DNA-adenine methylase
MPKMSTNGLSPFFCYFGGKWRAAKRYPKPLFPKIIEPFAGAAGYSLRHSDLDVILYDLDPAIYGMWDYLIKVSAEEIRKLPLEVVHVKDLAVCQEAKWLIGFWLNKGASTPHLTPSAWMRSNIRPNSYWGEVIRERIANQVDKIKHWKIINKSFMDADAVDATWFVDPPYQGECGRRYRCRIQADEYAKLGEWCKSRTGQIIVCERAGADWLPFQTFHTIKANPSSRGKSYSEEVIWTN